MQRPPSQSSPTAVPRSIPSTSSTARTSGATHASMKRKSNSVDYVISLRDLGPEPHSFDLPPTPQTPQFSGQAQIGHQSTGCTPHASPAHHPFDHAKNDTYRRKEQNRNAQRAFRERKEKQLQDLQGRVETLVAKQQPLTDENRCLKQLVHQLQIENHNLNAYKAAFDLVASDGLLKSNPTSPLTAEFQSRCQQAFNAGGDAYTPMNPQCHHHISPLTQNSIDSHNSLDHSSQCSLVSSSASNSLFSLPTPSEPSPAAISSVADVTSTLPSTSDGMYQSRENEIYRFPHANYLQHAPTGPKNCYNILPTSSLVQDSLPPAESSPAAQQLQDVNEDIYFSGPK